MVKGCVPCQHHQCENVKEPLHPHDVPQRPWHTIGSDLFFWNNSAYLLACDYYSKFPLLRKLNNYPVKHKNCSPKIFEEHGIPGKIVTGNHTLHSSPPLQFKMYGFTHTSRRQYYPQANGFIERNVQTVKHLLQKRKESGADPHLAMLRLRTTPLDHHLPSPAELLNSSVCQINHRSFSNENFHPVEDGDINTKLQLKQVEQKMYYDKSAKSLPPVYPCDPVRVLIY